MRKLLLLFPIVILILSGCGAITGIPSHGGGKRFATEQELVAAAARAAIAHLDLTPLKGKKVSLFINPMGDTGSGNLAGGRLSLVSQLRGQYLQNPEVRENMIYPRYTTHSESDSSQTSTSDDGFNSGTTTSTTHSTQDSEGLHNAPSQTVSSQKGAGANLQYGADYQGLGAFHNSEDMTHPSDDLRWLTGLFESCLFIQGIRIVPPSEAELDVYITIDIFGTVYTRVDWLLANNEILRARMSIDIMAVSHDSGVMVMAPRRSAMEAEYDEQYILWAGPVSIKKSINNFVPLADTIPDDSDKEWPAAKRRVSETPPRPFQDRSEQGE
ncbi:MAG: adhesin [Proteobacteria bacterium]|nr:adhesin [Pseudomonadota bacterium]